MLRKKGLGLSWCIFPGYKWCGPGCSGPGAPINDVDAACKAHDECYAKFGLSCKCDRKFLQDLRPKVNNHTKKGRRAGLLYKYMKMQAAYTCSYLGEK